MPEQTTQRGNAVTGARFEGAFETHLVRRGIGGLNLKEGDRIMNGRPINGTCLKCNKKTELVPLPIDQQNEPQVRLLYQIQQAMDEAVRRGERLSPSGMIWPLERVREWERWKRGEGSGS